MRALFLGYGPTRTRLIQRLSPACDVEWSEDPVQDLSPFDLVVSFGYRHILKPETLATAKRPVINLHIAYLPWGRGAHPLFWAAWEGRPQGVTIHHMDSGIDTGAICFRREVHFDYAVETFASAYAQLIADIELLFECNITRILQGEYPTSAQSGRGSFHRSRELPEGFTWDEKIGPTIERLKAKTVVSKLCQ